MRKLLGQKLIFIAHNYVSVNILGGTHALSLNIYNHFWRIVFFDYLYFVGGGDKTQRNLTSRLRSCS